jgi:anti-anti-sigma factor
MKQALSEQLEVEVGQTAGYPCIRMVGEGEPQGAQRLEQALAEIATAGHARLILDMRDVRFLDTACCEAVKAAVERAEEEGGCVVVVDQSLPLERALKLMGLEKITHVVPTLSEATRYLAAHC